MTTSTSYDDIEIKVELSEGLKFKSTTDWTPAHRIYDVRPFGNMETGGGGP